MSFFGKILLALGILALGFGFAFGFMFEDSVGFLTAQGLNPLPALGVLLAAFASMATATLVVTSTSTSSLPRAGTLGRALLLATLTASSLVLALIYSFSMATLFNPIVLVPTARLPDLLLGGFAFCGVCLCVGGILLLRTRRKAAA